MNYKILSGVFEGSVCEEGRILDVDVSKLDDDLQLTIRNWAEDQIGIKYKVINDGSDYARLGNSDKPIPLNDIKEDYEESWETEETEEAIDLKPVSEWL